MASKTGRRGTKRKAEEDEKPKEEKKEKQREDDQGGPRVAIEHWNSFEITLLDEGKETSLWTGIKKGPPRKMKFPQPDVVVTALQEALKTE
ncbi:Selenoprotein H [Takifugu flavidus]|uniref:Selenoprotein H n=1 Tax=Takifugu flavidus TaxID=433684 RepID=A0A5C6MKB6_9TELE|nr:Selenoprotein H [Takifugu flavidus]